ncbi:MAG TPA: ATP-binding protein [Kofleriaceae bacterium]|nr:ATP-binding protein [Kofleriaceae bacterium]
MWTRLPATRLRALWKQFPAVLILGARQVGKTTLARQVFPKLPYLDLEDPGLRQLFTADPRFQLDERAGAGLILDGVQAVPALFPALRGAIDADRGRRGRFLLLGSAQPELVRGVSETLAGRIGILRLDPLTAVEARRGAPRLGWRRLWLTGGFPDAARGEFREWWEAYLRTYVERDLPALGVPAEPLLLRRLLTMLAHQQGGLFNASQLGASLGVSYHTVQRYVDILEQTFLARRLTPYARNIRKRLTKSPKIYLRDTGLLHHLLNVGSLGELDSHPIRGPSWETFVIEDLLRREILAHPHATAHFWRTATGDEADLVLDRGDARFALEIKAGSGRDLDAARRLARCATDLGATKAWVVGQARGSEPLVSGVARRGFDQVIDWLP